MDSPSSDWTPAEIETSNTVWWRGGDSRSKWAFFPYNMAFHCHLTLERGMPFPAGAHVTFDRIPGADGVVSLHLKYDPYRPWTFDDISAELDEGLQHDVATVHHKVIKDWVRDNWDSGVGIHAEIVQLYQLLKEQARDNETAYYQAEAEHKALEEAARQDAFAKKAAEDLWKHSAESLAALERENRERAEARRGAREEKEQMREEGLQRQRAMREQQRERAERGQYAARERSMAGKAERVAEVQGMWVRTMNTFATHVHMADPTIVFANGPQEVQDMRQGFPISGMFASGTALGGEIIELYRAYNAFLGAMPTEAVSPDTGRLREIAQHLQMRYLNAYWYVVEFAPELCAQYERIWKDEQVLYQSYTWDDAAKIAELDQGLEEICRLLDSVTKKGAEFKLHGVTKVPMPGFGAFQLKIIEKIREKLSLVEPRITADLTVINAVIALCADGDANYLAMP